MKLLARTVAASMIVLFVLQPRIANAGTAQSKTRGYFTYLVYTAKLGETNNVTITGSAGHFTIHDTAGVTAATDCVQTDAMTATCTQRPSYPFAGVQVHTLDKNDVVHVNTDLFSTLNGGLGNDQLSGGTESDTLVGETGADVMSGGGGTDTADYSDRTAPLDVTIDGTANDGESGEGDNVLSDVENVTGGAANDHLTGSAAKNGLDGAGGDDLLKGLGGADTLSGRDGSNTLAGAGGSDTLYGGAGNDSITGAAGADTIYGSLGNNSLSGGPGDDTLYSYGGTTTDLDVCGVGTDSATVDSHDTVAADCENVTVV
jgi:Ca2+-binding RTX toxin-like protein